MADSGSRDLTRAEQSYVAQVTYQLRHLPRQRQHTMLQSLRRSLLAGPPVDTYARLERALGTPSDYAARLQGLGGGPPESRRRRRRSSRHQVRSGMPAWLGLTLVVVAAIVVSLALAALLTLLAR